MSWISVTWHNRTTQGTYVVNHWKFEDAWTCFFSSYQNQNKTGYLCVKDGLVVVSSDNIGGVNPEAFFQTDAQAKSLGERYMYQIRLTDALDELLTT